MDEGNYYIVTMFYEKAFLLNLWGIIACCLRILMNRNCISFKNVFFKSITVSIFLFYIKLAYRLKFPQFWTLYKDLIKSK